MNTKLIWGKSSTEKMNWQDAKEWCEQEGGRLPTRSELVQAYDDEEKGFKDDDYWSATTYRYNTASAWSVYFNSGFVGTYNKTTSLYYARCVRELN
jgi:hypothetical protein